MSTVFSRLILIMAAFVWLSSTASISAKKNEERLPTVSPILEGYKDRDSIEYRIKSSGPHRIEGIWQFQADGSTIAIERDHAANHGEGLSYRMVILRSSNRLLRPGTLIGILYPTGKKETFDAEIYTSDADGGKLRSAKKFTLTLEDNDSRIVFRRQKSKYTVNLWRLIPYMWRGVIRTRDNIGEAPDGCVKIFPTSTVSAEPRYL